jgi:hypothetical protein
VTSETGDGASATGVGAGAGADTTNSAGVESVGRSMSRTAIAARISRTIRSKLSCGAGSGHSSGRNSSVSGGQATVGSASSPTAWADWPRVCVGSPEDKSAEGTPTADNPTADEPAEDELMAAALAAGTACKPRVVIATEVSIIR